MTNPNCRIAMLLTNPLNLSEKWLKLSKDDATVLFAINGLGSGIEDESINSSWCSVSIRVKTPFFDYEQKDEELFDFSELLHLHSCLKKAVKGKLGKEEFVDFIEPDIDFKVRNEHTSLRLNLSACNAQYYTVPLFREDTKNLKAYLDERIPILEEQWRKAHTGG